jgi:hypothetical protein
VHTAVCFLPYGMFLCLFEFVLLCCGFCAVVSVNKHVGRSGGIRMSFVAQLATRDDKDALRSVTCDT